MSKEALKSAAAPPSLAPKRCAKVAGNQNLAQATGTRMVSKRFDHQLSGFRGIESDLLGLTIRKTLRIRFCGDLILI
jgi:hypothetical protein